MITYQLTELVTDLQFQFSIVGNPVLQRTVPIKPNSTEIPIIDTTLKLFNISALKPYLKEEVKHINIIGTPTKKLLSLVDKSKYSQIKSLRLYQFDSKEPYRIVLVVIDKEFGMRVHVPIGDLILPTNGDFTIILPDNIKKLC